MAAQVRKTCFISLMTSSSYSALSLLNTKVVRLLLWEYQHADICPPPSPSSSHLAAILNSQLNLSMSKKAVISQLELKPCAGFAADLLSSRIQDICSSQTVLQSGWDPVYSSLWNHVLRSSPSYTHVFGIRGKLLIRTIIHTWWCWCIYTSDQSWQGPTDGPC